MAQVAVEAVKIIRDSDGQEEVFEPSTDITTIPKGSLVESAVILDTTTGNETLVEAGNDVSKVVSIPNNTTFDSAEVPVSSGGWHVDVTLSDDKGYASVSSEWELTVNGTKRNDVFVTGHDTNIFQVRFVAGTTPSHLIKKADTVLVTHKIADSGIVKFLNKPVANNLP